MLREAALLVAKPLPERIGQVRTSAVEVALTVVVAVVRDAHFGELPGILHRQASAGERRPAVGRSRCWRRCRARATGSRRLRTRDSGAAGARRTSDRARSSSIGPDRIQPIDLLAHAHGVAERAACLEARALGRIAAVRAQARFFSEVKRDLAVEIGAGVGYGRGTRVAATTCRASSSGVEDVRDRADQLLPARTLGRQLFLAGRGEAVVPGALLLLGSLPVGGR